MPQKSPNMKPVNLVRPSPTPAPPRHQGQRRDLFAAAALGGLISRLEGEIGGRDQEHILAEIAFDFADAMISKS